MNITFNIATVQRRRASFIKVLKLLSVQHIPCDNINVAMSYDEPDNEIENIIWNSFKSNTILYGSFPCEKKLFAIDETDADTYFLTFDDDIIYPPDYSKTLIAGIEKYNRKNICSFHGMKFDKFPVTDYCGQRKLYQYFNPVQEDKQLDIFGSGVAGFYVNTLREKGFSFDVMNKSKNRTDDVMSKFCRENHIGMTCLKHRGSWLKIMPGTQDNNAGWKISAMNGHADKLEYLQC